MPRRATIPPRTRVFVGCEGLSEESYGRLIELEFEVHLATYHLDKYRLNPGAGDPLAMALRARQLWLHQQKIRGAYAKKLLVIDRDKYGATPARDREFDRIIAQEGVILIWQGPCHEGFLLRHLQGCEQLRPPTTPDAMRELTRRWPEYEKGMAALRLRERVKAADIIRAARSMPELARLLVEIGIPLNDL